MTSESIIGLLDRFEAWAKQNAVKPSWRLLRGWIEANYPQAHDKDALADEVWATPWPDSKATRPAALARAARKSALC